MVTQRPWLGLSVHKYEPYLNPLPMLRGREHIEAAAAGCRSWYY